MTGLCLQVLFPGKQGSEWVELPDPEGGVELFLPSKTLVNRILAFSKGKFLPASCHPYLTVEFIH